MKNPIKPKQYELTQKGIPLKAFEYMTTSEVKKLTKQYKRLINSK